MASLIIFLNVWDLISLFLPSYFLLYISFSVAINLPSVFLYHSFSSLTFLILSPLLLITLKN